MSICALLQLTELLLGDYFEFSVRQFVELHFFKLGYWCLFYSFGSAMVPRLFILPRAWCWYLGIRRSNHLLLSLQTSFNRESPFLSAHPEVLAGWGLGSKWAYRWSPWVGRPAAHLLLSVSDQVENHGPQGHTWCLGPEGKPETCIFGAQPGTRIHWVDLVTGSSK